MQTAMDQIEIFVDGLIRRTRLRAMANTVIAALRWEGLLLEKKAFKHLSAADRNDLRSLVRGESKSAKLSRLGEIQGLARHLNTDLRMGIGSVTSTPTSERDELVQSEHLKEDLTVRRHVFGMNTHSIKQSKSILIWQTFKRNCKWGRIQNVYILCGVVLLSLAITYPDHLDDDLELSTGLVILLVTIINVGTSLGIDFCLSDSLQKLALQREEHMQTHVIRCGRKCRVSTREIVVGDLVELSCGDRVPADGLLVECDSLQMIEGTNQDQHTSCSDSTFLTSGSIVQKSFCLMLVTAVGKDTLWTGHSSAWDKSLHSSTTESDISHDNTRAFLMQFRTSQDLLEKLMLYIMLLFLLIVSLANFYFIVFHRVVFIVIRRVDLKETHAIAVIYNLVYNFYDNLTFILTLVPFSLFMPFSLALLYFIPRMSADRALIMKLETCYRKLGSITTICTGKAGLLTYAEMEVKSSWIAGNLHDDEDHTTQPSSAMREGIQALFFEGLVLNSGSRSVSLEESCGSRTENVLLRWGQACLRRHRQDGMTFDTIRQSYTVLKVEPFDSERKRSGVFLRRGDGNCIVHWKGAADTILSSCSRWICADAESGRTTIMTLSVHDRSDIEAIIANMENTGLRCVAFAYCEVALARAQAASGSMQSGGRSRAHISLQEVDLTLLAVVGMKETCRPEATEDVTKARNAGLRVIMVTGDSIETARVIAKECGIINEESHNIEDQVVDGSTFREWTPSDRQQRLERLTVLARASVHDKQLLVAGLQANVDEVVAVTGHKHADVDVLQKADVGFSLGSGKQVAMESSDIILLDDSFRSLWKAIEWGRCMRCNLQYFLHFVLTMGVATPLISQLSGTQFQWIDFITMLASIAVIMQPSLPSLMLQPPILQDLHTNVMLRNLFLQAMYQVILFIVVIDYKDSNLNRTIVFNSFIFCQLINIVNTRQLHIVQSLRRLHTEKGKIFLRGCWTNIIQKNLLLFAMITIIAFMQVVLIQFGGPKISSVPLNWKEWLFCVGLAIGSWVLGILGEFLPMPNTPHLRDFAS